MCLYLHYGILSIRSSAYLEIAWLNSYRKENKQDLSIKMEMKILITISFFRNSVIKEIRFEK